MTKLRAPGSQQSARLLAWGGLSTLEKTAPTAYTVKHLSCALQNFCRQLKQTLLTTNNEMNGSNSMGKVGERINQEPELSKYSRGHSSARRAPRRVGLAFKEGMALLLFPFNSFLPFFLLLKEKNGKRKKQKTKHKTLSLYTLCELVIELDCWKKIIHYKIFAHNFLFN